MLGGWLGGNTLRLKQASYGELGNSYLCVWWVLSENSENLAMQVRIRGLYILYNDIFLQALPFFIEGGRHPGQVGHENFKIMLTRFSL